MRKTLRIGDILIEEGKITQDQLMHALGVQKDSNFSKKLGEIFVEEGLIGEKEFAQVLASQFEYEFIDLYSININFSTLKNFSLNVLKSADAII